MPTRGLRASAWITTIAVVLPLIGGCADRDAARAPQTTTPAPATAPATDDRPLSKDQREAALNEIRRKRIEAAERERVMREQAQRERQALQQSGGKCIDGRAYRKEGNEWQEVGPC